MSSAHTNQKQYDATVFIGRFQPIHAGHVHVIQKALDLSNTAIILVGSAFSSRTIRNPFTFEERRDMIKSVFSDPRVVVLPIPDFPYDDNRWIVEVRKGVSGVTHSENIALIGHEKDHTSFYLKLFPTWDSISVPNYQQISSTPIRMQFLKTLQYEQNLNDPRVPVDLSLYQDRLVSVREDLQMVEKYQQAWEHSPYPPTFVTVDSVVVQSGHILLVKRGALPGKGLWALPGGFIRQDERLLDGAIRELREETKLKVPAPVLKGSLKQQMTFDDPHRSSRGRTITTAFHFSLEQGSSPEIRLPKVKGGDDAQHAFWMPINEVPREQMFEDHYGIMSYFLNI